MAMGLIVFTAIKNILAMKVESTAYTNDPPASADHNIKWSSVSAEIDREEYEQMYASGRHSAGPSTMGAAKVVYKASAPWLFGSAAGVAPRVWKALQACGALQTISLTASTDLITANSTIVTLTVGATDYATSATVYASSHASTIAAIAVKVAALNTSGLCTCTASGDVLTIVAKPGILISAVATTTLGASQPTWTGAMGLTPDQSCDQTPYSFAMQAQAPSGNAVTISGKGGMGTFQLVTKNDALCIELTFTAALVDITDVAGLVLTSPDTGQAPLITKNTTITIASESIRIGKFLMDAVNDIQPIKDGSTYLGFYIAGRKPVLGIDPAMDLLLNATHYTRWAAGTQAAFSATSTAVSSRVLTVTAPKAQIKGSGLKIAARGQENTYDQSLSLQENSGNDEWRLGIT